jgi:hypothetical protein
VVSTSITSVASRARSCWIESHKVHWVSSCRISYALLSSMNRVLNRILI